MKKLLVLLLIFSYTSTLFGAYDVKIGVYQNAKNLRANIAKIKSSKYRNYIVIETKHKRHYAHAVIESGVEAKKALHVYKRVFKDAFISKTQVRQKKIAKKISAPLVKKRRNEKKVVKEKIQDINAKELLGDKTIYLCYEQGPRHLKDRVVEMVFEKEYVTYNPLKKMSTPVKMPYQFKNNILTLQLSEMTITHDIYKKEPNFLYAKSMIDGLVVNKLRYYFDKRAALAYVGKE